MAHWLYIVCAMGGSAGFAAACRDIPRAFLMLVGGLTASPQRSKQCEDDHSLAGGRRGPLGASFGLVRDGRGTHGVSRRVGGHL